MTGRRGIWRCPSCSKHQTWKSRDQSTTRLDRKCISCEQRIRVTLDRSNSGRGRKQQAQVWERPTETSLEELQQEVSLRDSGETIADSRTERAGPSNQQDLPPLWGAGWSPRQALEFAAPQPNDTARSDMMRFLIERYDGHGESAV